MSPGTIGAIGGIAGALIGSYFSIKNTNSQRERRFVICTCVACWVYVGAFLTALALLPSTVKPGLWITYILVLVIGVGYLNKKQAAIRHEDDASSGTG